MDHLAPPLVAALADKYRRLLALRLGADAQPPVAELRALARQFPGALRELDQLPLEVIRVRLAALESVVTGDGALEQWMMLQASYHGVMRATLRIKRWSRSWSREPDSAARELAARYVPAPDEPAVDFFDAAVLLTIRDPPGGRLNPLVLAAVARLHGVDADHVRRALFPR
jgi:hypothetical protein